MEGFPGVDVAVVAAVARKTGKMMMVVMRNWSTQGTEHNETVCGHTKKKKNTAEVTATAKGGDTPHTSLSTTTQQRARGGDTAL